ncbi:MAG: hypothetical protein Q4B40_06015 [Clostridia bacterium]|nr:hypothetical protein [Clostridia bacterium]
MLKYIPNNFLTQEQSIIKSATDNIGTFDGNNPDIRFSERLQAEELKTQREANRYLEKENSKLREDVENLKQMLQLQKQITHGEMFTKSSLDIVAKRLMGFASARGNRTELVALVNDLYKHIAWQELSDMYLELFDAEIKITNTLTRAGFYIPADLRIGD